MYFPGLFVLWYSQPVSFVLPLIEDQFFIFNSDTQFDTFFPGLIDSSLSDWFTNKQKCAGIQITEEALGKNND